MELIIIGVVVAVVVAGGIAFKVCLDKVYSVKFTTICNLNEISRLRNDINKSSFNSVELRNLKQQNKFLTKENLKLNEQIALIAKHLEIEFKTVERKDEYMKIRKVK